MAAAKPSATPASKPKSAKAAPSTNGSAPANAASDDRLLAMLAHLLGIVSGFIGALVIWLVKKDSPVVEAHAREALNFQITLAIAYVVGIVLILVLVGFVILLAVGVLSIVFSILAAVAANKGNDYRYPMTLRLVKAPA